MGFNVGSLHIEVPALALTVFVGGIVVVLFWAALSAAFGPKPDDREVRDDRYPRRLDRSRRRALGGVCAGIARYFGWQVGATRAGFVLLAIFSAGFTVPLVYLVLWRVMPLEPVPQAEGFSLADYRVD